jgi:hypothetical protein
MGGLLLLRKMKLNSFTTGTLIQRNERCGTALAGYPAFAGRLDSNQKPLRRVFSPMNSVSITIWNLDLREQATQ